MKWQPIETAPMGVDVLVYFPARYDNPPLIVVMLRNIRGFWKGYYHATGPDGLPTHWMPLPPPPEDEP